MARSKPKFPRRLPNTFPNTPSYSPLFLTRILGIEAQSKTPRLKLFTTLNHRVGGSNPSQPTYFFLTNPFGHLAPYFTYLVFLPFTHLTE